MLFAPDYYKSFKCIADKCTDSCCIGWEIDVDCATVEKYRALGTEGEEILSKVDLSCDTPYIMLDERERCPFLDERGLCRIISRYGDSYIPDICKNHPRYFNSVSESVECGLGLACPEAARIILSVSQEPKLEILSDCSTRFDKFEKKENDFPTYLKMLKENKDVFPTNKKYALFELRERLFSFIFDKTHPLSAVVSGLISYDKSLFDSVFDMHAGGFSGFSEIKVGDFGEISPLVSYLRPAIQSLEVLSEDFRHSFAEPSLSVIRERLVLLGDRARALLYYFIHRYFLAGIDEFDLDMRLSLCVMLLFLSLLCIDDFGDEGVRASLVAFSKNVEYSTENIEILLDILTEL